MNYVDELAHRIAALHQDLPAVSAKNLDGTPDAVLKPLLKHLRQLHGLLQKLPERARLHALLTWLNARYGTFSRLITKRRAQGFVRVCHSDLYIDTINAVAVLMMDLEERGPHGSSFCFLNLYLEDTGDYAGLTLLRFYQISHMVICAQDTAMQLTQRNLNAAERIIIRARCQAYLDLALRNIRPVPRLLTIAHGPSGAGKTTVTNHLLERVGAVRIRSDVERKRLFGLAPLARSGSQQFAGIYTAEANQRTYQRIEELAAQVLAAGFPVIVEATFLKRRGRDAMRALAAQEGARFALLDLHATPDTLRTRVAERQLLGLDASEAGIAVLEHQLVNKDPLTADEMNAVIVIDTESKVNMDDIVEQLLS